MRPRTILLVSNFFFAIFSGLITFVMLPSLTQFMSVPEASFVLAGGALLALLIFPSLPRLVEHVGAKNLALAFTLIEIAVLFGLSGTPGLAATIILFMLTVAVQPCIAYELDLLLEATIVEHAAVGRVRSLFRTAWNLAGLVSPLLLGAILVESEAYSHVFIVAGAMLAPLIVFFTANRLPRGPTPKPARLRHTLLAIARNHDLGAVTVANFCLYLFLAWAPLYTPLYLHDMLQIPWSTLGWLFAVMLVPYVLIEYPAGLIADRYLGDKELMFAGFIIAGGGLASLANVSSTTPLITILLILVGSRIGAALLESTVEAHFFRRVARSDINSVSIFRATWPLSYLIAPLLGSVLLTLGGYHAFFLYTGGFIAICGVLATLLVRDFR